MSSTSVLDINTLLASGAFRRLLSHLAVNSGAVTENALMTTAGFCRGCLAKWVQKAAIDSGRHEFTSCDAEGLVFGDGITYEAWKREYNETDGALTPVEIEAFEGSRHLHAMHGLAVVETTLRNGGRGAQSNQNGAIDDSVRRSLEASAFRSLIAHLDLHANDISNMSVMTVGGFCRNCLSKWYLSAASEDLPEGLSRAVGLTLDDAHLAVYGEPYAEWKRKHHSKATPDQLARYEASKGIHARHGSTTPAGPAAGAGAGASAVVVQSDVCCRDPVASPPPALVEAPVPVPSLSENNAASSSSSSRGSKYPMTDVDEALATVLRCAERAVPAFERLSLPLALGRVAAEDIHAAEPVPPFRASIMDGYAVVAADLAGEGGTGGAVLRVVDSVTAGSDPTLHVTSGFAAYITTGAKVPEGADAVLKIEDTAEVPGADQDDQKKGGEEEEEEAAVTTENQFRALKSLAVGANIRPIGHDIPLGQRVVAAGTTLLAAELGVLAALGVATVAVNRPPTVGVLSTGDELLPPEHELSDNGGGSSSAVVAGGCGKIRDCNRTALMAQLRSAEGLTGVRCVDLGMVGDRDGELRAALVEALRQCDVLVTTGGVSMGELDLLKPLLEEMGTVHFGRFNMKPGKPTTFATVPNPGGDGDGDGDGGRQQRLVFALPGNPVSGLVTLHLLVIPALRRLIGQPSARCVHSQVDARLTEPLKLDPERPEYHRAAVHWDGVACSFVARSTGRQQSSRLLSLCGANALLCLPRASGVLPAGSFVPALLIGPLPPPPASLSFHQSAALVDRRPAVSGEARTAGGAAADANPECALPSSAYVSFPSPGDDKGDAPDGGRQKERRDEAQRVPSAQPVPGGPTIRVCLLTVSDRASSGTYADRSGPAMAEALVSAASSSPAAAGGFNIDIVERRIVPDEAGCIRDAVRRWADDLAVDVVLTSGGTGFGPRDGTPEAVRPLLHREAPGIVFAMLQSGVQHTPFAVLARPVAGTRGKTLIATLPGSPLAAAQGVQALLPFIPPIVSLQRV